MAVFRKVHVSFWKDVFVEGLTPEQKFFYLYLLTNDRTTQCGIYEITTRQMSYDTGYNFDTIDKLIGFFELKQKLRYNRETSEMALKNWPKYNDSTSPKVKSCISNELKVVKDRVLIEYVYSMDTHSQEEKEEEQEKEEDVETEYSKLDPKRKQLFEMFRRCAPVKVSDAELIIEIGKFLNKYPDKLVKESGPLINAWCSNIGKNKQPADKKKVFFT